jgi:hypothetical protein
MDVCSMQGCTTLQVSDWPLVTGAERLSGSPGLRASAGCGKCCCVDMAEHVLL